MWLDASELRIGLGCMRLSSAETIEAALEAGITVFDTARAYEGNEELLASVLRGTRARIVTKGGMAEGWVPDGRAKSIRADCEASLAALDGLPIDTYLLQALELAPIAAVQVALSVFDDRALRGGIVERCTELGIALIAHSPLGGPRRA